MKKLRKILTALIASLLLQTASLAAPLWNIQDGIRLFNAQKYEEALEFFEGYVQNTPNDTDGHYYLGLVYKALGDFNLSTYHLQKSYELSKNLEKINIAPKDRKNGDSAEEDYFDIASSYFDSGDFTKALQYTDLILNLNQNSTDALVLKAKIYFIQENLNLSKVYFQKALLIDNGLINSDLARKLGVNAIPNYDFDYYNTKGLEYYYSGNPKTAIDYFNKAIKLDPSSVTAQNNLALAYLKTGDFDSAKEALNKAIKIDKNFNLSYINLAKLEAQLNKIKNKSSESKKVEDYLLKAIKVNPNSKFAYLELGNYYLENKDFSKAAQSFGDAVLIDDKFYEAYLGLAVASVEDGNLSDGIKAARKASSLAGDGVKNADLLYYLARICVLDGNFEEAKNYLLQAVSKSQNPNYYFELGKIYYRENDLASSRNAFTKAMELDLEFKYESEIYNYLGLIEFRNMDAKKAVYMFKKATELDNTRAMYHYNLAQAYKNLNEKTASAKELQEVDSIKPKTAQDYLDFSTIYYDKKNNGMALKMLEEGVLKFPDSRALWEAKLRFYRIIKDVAGENSTKAQIKARFKK